MTSGCQIHKLVVQVRGPDDQNRVEIVLDWDSAFADPNAVQEAPIPTDTPAGSPAYGDLPPPTSPKPPRNETERRAFSELKAALTEIRVKTRIEITESVWAKAWNDWLDQRPLDSNIGVAQRLKPCRSLRDWRRILMELIR